MEAELTVGSLVTRLATVLAREAILARLRTVTNTVALFATVEALDYHALSLLLLLRAMLGNMAKLVTVTALVQTSINNLTSVLETLLILLNRLRPSVRLAGSGWLKVEAIRHSISLVQVTLEIHVGHSL